MLRILLATTTLATLGASSALAQDQGSAQQDDTTLQLEAQQPGGNGPLGDRQQVTVNSGDTIVVQPDQTGAFTLNFQFDQSGAMPSQFGVTGRQMAPAQQDLRQGDPEQLSAENLIGSEVYGANDENIGNVGDVVLTPEGEVDAMVVDVGGFLGIGARQVAIGVDNLRFMIDAGDNWHVFTPFTESELENQPEYDEQSYADQRDDQRMTAPDSA